MNVSEPREQTAQQWLKGGASFTSWAANETLTQFICEPTADRGTDKLCLFLTALEESALDVTGLP